MSNLNIHESLTYSQPQISVTGPLNYVSYKPSGAQVFAPGDSFTIKLSSNTDFVDLQRSYMKYTVTPSSTSGNLSPMGGSSIFNSVSDQLGGLQFGVSRNYAIQRSLQLSTDTLERQSVTGTTEFFTGTTGIACTAGNFNIVSPPVTSIITDKMIPLAFLNAGHLITYTLNPAVNVVSVGSYTVSNVEFVAACVTPTAQYLEEISRGLASGNALKIPVSLYKSITSSLTSTSQQDLNFQIGFLSSINTVSIVEKSVSLGPMQNANDLNSFYVLLDGQRYPKNKSIFNGPESFYQILAGYSTQLSSIKMFNSNQPFQQYSFKQNEDFGTGIASANGTLTLSLDFTGNIPAAGSTLECIVSYDAMILIAQNTCSLVVDI